MATEKRTALFVRLPQAQARRVDAAARRMGQTKQDFVVRVLEASLDGADRTCPEPAEPKGRGGSVVDEVLTLQEVAAFLKVGVPEVMDRVTAGDLPGRCFGEQWRFSHRAVLEWLDGTEADRRQYGFRSTKQGHGAPSATPRRRGSA